MKGVIMRFVDEWRAIPWTPRARHAGRTIEDVAILLFPLLAAALLEGVFR